MNIRALSILVILLALVSSTMIGCEAAKLTALQADTQIALVVEGAGSLEIEALVSEVFERPIYTPTPEQHFYLTTGNDDSLKQYSKWPFVLLAGTLDSDDPVSLRLQKTLKGEVLEGVKSGQYTIFRKTDLWAKKQTVVFMIAPTMDDLKKYLVDNNTELYNIFNDDRIERQKTAMYSMYEQTDLSDSLLQAHGFKLRIQHDYALAKSNRSRIMIIYPRLRQPASSTHSRRLAALGT